MRSRWRECLSPCARCTRRAPPWRRGVERTARGRAPASRGLRLGCWWSARVILITILSIRRRTRPWQAPARAARAGARRSARAGRRRASTRANVPRRSGPSPPASRPASATSEARAWRRTSGDGSSSELDRAAGRGGAPSPLGRWRASSAASARTSASRERERRRRDRPAPRPVARCALRELEHDAGDDAERRAP